MIQKYFSDGVVYNADCFEVFPKLEDKSVDCILCDLPYGATRNTWDKPLPLNELWQQYKRILKPHGVVLLFGQNKFTNTLINSNTPWYRYNLVWDKVLPAGFLNANRMPLRTHEDICVFYKQLPPYHPQKTPGAANHTKGACVGKHADTQNNYGDFVCTENTDNMKHPTSILRFSKPHPSVARHPTEKPVALLEFLIKAYTNADALILDNCMGVGSTCVAAHNTGRRFVGIELQEHYYSVAVERLLEGGEA